MRIECTREEWRKICRKYNRWCLYDEIRELPVEIAEIYIISTPFIIEEDNTYND
jgi:hypothetical protein